MPYATTVINRTREMLENGFLKTPPAWWSTVQAFPPISANARTFVKRDAADLPSTEPLLPNKRDFRARGEGIKPIRYELTDQLRDRFYRDHPWEGAKPQTLVEGPRTELDLGEKGQGPWTELRQRVMKPSPDDCIDFAVNLHRHHSLTLNDAYRTAVDQFRSLRARHEIETRFALYEARAHGATFGPGKIGNAVAKEDAALKMWSRASVVPAEGGKIQRHISPVTTSKSSATDSIAGRARSEIAGQQYTRPITDGTINAVGHARREANPQFTGGLSYLVSRHKLDQGDVGDIRLEAQTGVLQQHDASPKRTVFRDYRRTLLERRGKLRGEGRLATRSKGKRRPRKGH